jgi:hypothetical protein
MPRNWQFSQVRRTLSIAQKQFFVGKAAGEFRMNKTLRLEAPILNGFWASRSPSSWYLSWRYERVEMQGIPHLSRS